MNYLSYQNARDTVWELIIKHDISSLPVKISEVCRREGIRMISYSAGRELIKFLCLENYAEANDGFSTESSGSRIIFYNDKCTVGRQRFTVDRELAHPIPTARSVSALRRSDWVIRAMRNPPMQTSAMSTRNF